MKNDEQDRPDVFDAGVGSHVRDLPIQTAELGTTEASWVRTMLAACLLFLSVILLAAGPAVVIAAWKWAL